MVSENGSTPGDKAVIDDRIIERSAIEPRTEREGAASTPADYGSLLFFIAGAADEITPWGVNYKLRDRQLREFIPTENVFASALQTMVARNAAFSWEVEGPPRTAAKVHDILDKANFGEGWLDFIAKISTDLYTQDSGAFIEIVRETDSETAPVIAVNHLDAGRCWHTGIVDLPVLYQDRLGRYHLLRRHQVITLAEAPTPVELLYGLQYCALTRLLRAAQIIKNVNTYKYEKTGGRRTRAIHLVRGVSTNMINQAMAQMTIRADNQGLQRFLQPVILGTVDPNVELQTATLEFATLPDGYDEEETMKQYITQIAMAFQADYQDFAPLPGGNLGTAAQSETLMRKSRGKGPALFMKLIANAFNGRILPQNVEFVWKEQDIDAEEKQAEVKAKRAESRAKRIESGEITVDVARQIAVDEGDLEEEYMKMMGGIDATPDVSLEDDRPTAAQLAEDNPPPGTVVPPAPDEETFLAERAKALVEIVVRNVPEAEKGRLGEFLQTRIHKAFTIAADDLAALGYMDTKNRIKLSNIIGDALGKFADLCGEEIPEIAMQELNSEDARRLLDEKALPATLEEVNDDRIAFEGDVAGRLAPLLADMHAEVKKRLEALQVA